MEEINRNALAFMGKLLVRRRYEEEEKEEKERLRLETTVLRYTCVTI